MQLPDYQGGSIVNLMQSIRDAAGGTTTGLYPPLAHGALAGLAGRRIIVLLVIDGLGYDYLCQRGDGSCLHSYLRGSVTSVFPSTTATSITTFLTGEAPQQHGLTGWFVYMKELGAVTTVLPFTLRGSRELLSERGLSAEVLYGHRPFASGLGIDSSIVSPNWIIGSDFNRAHCGPSRTFGYDDLPGMFEQLSAAIRQQDKRQYIYAYWPDFDRLSHQYGNNSEQVLRHFREIDEAFARLLEEIDVDEVGIVVTADHGFIDTDQQRTIVLNDHPELYETLMLPLCGEPRTAYCYVQPGKEKQFVDYVSNELGDFLDCYRSEALLEQGAFGLGTPHPQLHERIGHYTLVMKENYAIKDWLAGEKRFFQYGVHGGVSEQEMKVPLVVV